LRAQFKKGGARKIAENLADIKAQVAANHKGLQLLEEADRHYGAKVISAYMGHIQDVSAKAIREKLKKLARTKDMQLKKMLLCLMLKLQAGKKQLCFQH